MGDWSDTTYSYRNNDIYAEDKIISPKELTARIRTLNHQVATAERLVQQEKFNTPEYKSALAVMKREQESAIKIHMKVYPEAYEKVKNE